MTEAGLHELKPLDKVRGPWFGEFHKLLPEPFHRYLEGVFRFCSGLGSGELATESIGA
jgi:hypothetical protein